MHLIHKHSIHINCSKEQTAHLLKDEVADVLKYNLYPKLDTLIKQYDNPNNVISIDYLPITIPNTNLKNWKEKLVEESLSQVETYFQSNINSINYQNDGAVNSNQKIDFKLYTQQLFIDYLLTGTLKSNAISEELLVIYHELVVDNVFAQKLMNNLANNIPAILRWSLNIPEDIHQKLTLLFTEDNSLIGFQNEIKKIKISNLKHYENLFNYFYWLAFFKRNNRLIKSEKETIIRDCHNYFGFNSSATKNIVHHLKTTFKKETYLSSLIEQFSINDFSKNEIARSKQDNDLNNVITKVLEDYNNLKEKEAITEYWYIINSGLIILHPFLKLLFKNIGYLTKDNHWKNTQVKHRAVLLLQYLIIGKEDVFENDLILNKILCGVPINQPVITDWKITSDEKKQCESLLKSVIEHWKVLKNTSVSGLQESFLQRNGKLEIIANGNYKLVAEQQSIDILLDQLPWGLGMIKTPWMKELLNCYWT
ncbi:contractile injection system tape measure protein [Lutibacter citreus]|uniref:contractile injection system tape measure protein n=1 Tax=Lutibacter citreus TaxID=2138210 RepID=UPI000DBE241A|nr:contractile injection system tape measure protein [Lutibacter citreus]